MSLVVGCDGGGSKTVVRIRAFTPEGTTREATASSGSANMTTDFEAAMAHIRQATLSAQEQLKCQTTPPFDAMVVAVAGAGRKAVRDKARRRLHELLPIKRLDVVPDVSALFPAAMLYGPGVALSVGTGSIALARDRVGTERRFGGRGPLLGDEGGGYWIGLEAVKRCVRTLSKSSPEAPDPMWEILLDYFGVKDVDALIAAVYQVTRPCHVIAGLTPEVFRCAGSSDAAADLIADAANELSELMCDASRFATSKSGAQPPWVVSGGLLSGQPSFCEMIRQRCHTKHCLLGEPIRVVDPVAGAMKLAEKMLSVAT